MKPSSDYPDNFNCFSSGQTFIEIATRALRYGLRVVPVSNDEFRRPIVKWGRDAGFGTDDLVQVKKWSSQFAWVRPQCGAVTGTDTHWAVDIDEPHALSTKLRNLLTPRRNFVVVSGGGGQHVHFKHDARSRELIAGGSFSMPGKKRTMMLEVFVTPHILHAPGCTHHRTGRVYQLVPPKAKVPTATPQLIEALMELRSIYKPRVPDHERTIKAGLWSHSALGDALEASQIECEDLGDKFAVLCPWGHNETLTTKATVFVRDGWPCYSCFAPDCQMPKKTWAHFRDAYGMNFNIRDWIDKKVAECQEAFRCRK